MFGECIGPLDAHANISKIEELDQTYTQTCIFMVKCTEKHCIKYHVTSEKLR